MNKILKLLIDDYQTQDTSAEYKFLLQQVCIAEKCFIDSLNNKQRKMYLQLEALSNGLGVIEQNDLAEFLFENLKN